MSGVPPLCVLPWTYQHAVKGGRGPSALHMAEDGDPRVEAQALHHQLWGRGDITLGTRRCPWVTAWCRGSALRPSRSWRRWVCRCGRWRPRR